MSDDKDTMPALLARAEKHFRDRAEKYVAAYGLPFDGRDLDDIIGELSRTYTPVSTEYALELALSDLRIMQRDTELGNTTPAEVLRDAIRDEVEEWLIDVRDALLREDEDEG